MTVPTLALAQDTQAKDTAAAMQEDEAAQSVHLVVTANRTASLASKNPIALTAVSGESLIQAGITNPTQPEEPVPIISIAGRLGVLITDPLPGVA